MEMYFCGYVQSMSRTWIVHGGRYENASEQRAHFVLKEDLLTPLDKLSQQEEYPGFGAVSPDADEKIKENSLVILRREDVWNSSFLPVFSLNNCYV